MNLQKSQEKLAQLQQELTTKVTHQLILWLNHPDRRYKDVKNAINCSPDKAKKLCEIKTEAEGIGLIGGLYWQQLKCKYLPPSNEQKKLEERIGKLQQRISSFDSNRIEHHLKSIKNRSRILDGLLLEGKIQ